MRYRVGIVPPGSEAPASLHLLAGDSVHVTVEHHGLTWDSTWTATGDTWLDFTHWIAVEPAEPT